jgi:hypothetical protein
MRALFPFETLGWPNPTAEHKSQVTRIINLVSCWLSCQFIDAWYELPYILSNEDFWAKFIRPTFMFCGFLIRQIIIIVLFYFHEEHVLYLLDLSDKMARFPASCLFSNRLFKPEMHKLSKKYKSRLKILRARRAVWSKYNSVDIQILHTTVKSVDATQTGVRGLSTPFSKYLSNWGYVQHFIKW